MRRQILSAAEIPEDAKILLYAGRISPEKNVALLNEIMRTLVGNSEKSRANTNYQLLIAGDGPQFKWLNDELEKSAPGHFKFLGHITEKTDLADLYANADIFIHPNPREPFGIAPLEAMASGTPVIVPDSGGVLSYATAENAWICPPTAKDFCAAIDNIFENSETRRTKIQNALETVRNFTWEKSFERCFDLYDKLHAEFRASQTLAENEPNLVITPLINVAQEKHL